MDDQVAWHFLDAGERDLVARRSELFRTGPVRGFRRRLLGRQRFAEDALARSVTESRDGTGWQYVLLGAGLDSFAWRQPAWRQSLSIFEVDRPAEQTSKLERLDSSGLGVPSNLRFVAADFEDDDLWDRLLAAGLLPELPTFFACLGVLVYLTPGAIERLLGLPLRIGGPAQIAFSTSGDIGSGSDRVLARLAAASGEEWISPLEPDAMQALLTRIGYTAVAATDTDRYLTSVMPPDYVPSGSGAPSHLFLATK